MLNMLSRKIPDEPLLQAENGALKMCNDLSETLPLIKLKSP